MRVTRWLLLVLYVLLIIGFVIGEISENDLKIPVLSLVTVVGLVIFIFGAGTKNLCRPIRRPRLVLPVAVAAFMFCVLIAGLTLAFSELFDLRQPDDSEILFWMFLVFNWLSWGALLYVYTRNIERYRAIHRLAKLLFAGSLAELLAAVPSHIFVERRGGCFAGLTTGIGVMAGVYVMAWSFGPGIMLLFLNEAYRRQTKMANRQVKGRPPRKSPLQFHLRTMLLVTLALGVDFALIRIVWGNWRAGALAGILAIFLLALLLIHEARLLTVSALLVIAGLFFITWQEWTAFVYLVLISVIMLPLVWQVYDRRTLFLPEE